MKLIRRIVIGFGITVAVLCLSAIVLFNWSAMGWKALAVPTGSMSPNINPGSLVLVHSVPNASLKVGDVITYANPLKKSSSITHRITKTYKLDNKVPAFITKGDANPAPDRPVVGGQVKGKVVWSIPYVGSALSWTHTLFGILLLIYLPALIVVFDEVKRLSIYYRRMMPYKAAVVLAREKLEAQASRGTHRFAATSAISVAILAGSIFIPFPVYALLTSNTVSLAPNTLRVAAVTPPTNICAGTGNSTSTTVNINGSGSSSNNNNVNVSNNSNQNATSGNATNSNNNNGGSATSGNATNCNSTNININITNH